MTVPCSTHGLSGPRVYRHVPRHVVGSTSHRCHVLGCSCVGVIHKRVLGSYTPRTSVHGSWVPQVFAWVREVYLSLCPTGATFVGACTGTVYVCWYFPQVCVRGLCTTNVRTRTLETKSACAGTRSVPESTSHDTVCTGTCAGTSSHRYVLGSLYYGRPYTGHVYPTWVWVRTVEDGDKSLRCRHLCVYLGKRDECLVHPRVRTRVSVYRLSNLSCVSVDRSPGVFVGGTV